MLQLSLTHLQSCRGACVRDENSAVAQPVAKEIVLWDTAPPKAFHQKSRGQLTRKIPRPLGLRLFASGILPGLEECAGLDGAVGHDGGDVGGDHRGSGEGDRHPFQTHPGGGGTLPDIRLARSRVVTPQA